MKIAMTGSTGLIGNALREFFSKNGHTVTRIVRRSTYKDPDPSLIFWDPLKKEIDIRALEQQEVIIHLAGENIGAGRWTLKRKEEIRRSRLLGTSFLSATLAGLKNRPKVFFSASAIGFYGNQENGQPLDESSSPPAGFLPGLCRNWEEATTPADKAGIRVVNMRFGVVLSPKGGALAKMLPIFKLGLGGKIGTGQQMMSWVSLDEIPGIILYLIGKETVSGPVNFVSPNAVSNLEFTRALGHILKRPTLFPLPAVMVKIMFGEMGEELLLGGANIIPKRLQAAGYPFVYPDLQKALSHLLNRPTRAA